MRPTSPSRVPGRRAAAAVLAAASLLGAASAEPEPTASAVARLNHAGYNTRQHCSAALIGPLEVLTAKHCVEGLDPTEMHVLLGYDRGDYAEHRRGASAQLAPGQDIARLCLDAAPAMDALPASDGARPEPGDATVRGYPASRAHAQTERRCRLEPMPGRPLALLDCPLEQGMSGAPVTMEGRGIVGVVSASNTTGSLAVLLDALPEGGC